MLSAENLRAAGYRVVVQVAPPPGPEEHDLRTYDERTDALIKGLTEAVSSLSDLVMLMGLRLDRLEGRDG